MAHTWSCGHKHKCWPWLGWVDQHECRCSRSAALLRISTNIKVGCLFLFHSPVFFPVPPHSLSLPACSCIAINRRATVPYFWAQRDGGREGKEGCRERQLLREKRREWREGEEAHRKRDSVCGVCRSDLTPCDAIRARIRLCDHRFSSWYNKQAIVASLSCMWLNTTIITLSLNPCKSEQPNPFRK